MTRFILNERAQNESPLLTAKVFSGLSQNLTFSG